MNSNTALILLGVSLVILGVVFGPFITIWSLNTLFAMNIAYTFWNWLAVIALHATIRGLFVNLKKSS